MNKQEKLKQLKKEVEKLEEELKNELVIQNIKAKKLEWGKTAEKIMNWEEAKEWCKKQGKGWRLPTLIELLQAYNDNIFGFSKGSHWSSTEYLVSLARYVRSSDGDVDFNGKASSYAVRCVRGS